MGVFNSVRDEFLLIFLGDGAIARQSLEYPGKSCVPFSKTHGTAWEKFGAGLLSLGFA